MPQKFNVADERQQVTMKAISLWQPWATLMVEGIKQVETRSWKTNYRGILVVHAAKKNNGWPDEEIKRAYCLNTHNNKLPAFDDLPFGKLLGVVLLSACIRILPRTDPDHIKVLWPEVAFGDYTPGRWAWVTQGYIKFKKPVPFRGRQGLFNVPDSLVGEALGWPGGCKFEGAYGSDECSPLEYHD